MKAVLWLDCSVADVSVWHLSMYRFVTLLTKAVVTQMGIFLSIVRETRNISAQVVSLPLVFLKSGFLFYCLIPLGWKQEFFYVLEDRVLGIYVAMKVQAVGCWLGGEACW